MYTLIEHRRLDSDAASITFSSIPQIYTDLLVLTSLRDTSGNAGWATAEVRPNGATTNISARVLFGWSTNVGSFVDTQIYHQLVRGATTANTFSNSSVYISNYRSSTSKSFSVDTSTERNDAASINAITAGLWSVNDPITSISIVPPAGSNLAQYSSATLYGINRTTAFGKPKAIGGTITQAGGFWYHTFTGSGTLYTQEDIEYQALVVAGGGGGGGAVGNGGGGGAGGFISTNGFISKDSSALVVVGAGGPGMKPLQLSPPSNGQNSQFLASTAIGGGGGGGYNGNYSSGGVSAARGANGGSGGGAWSWASQGGAKGLGTAGQGNDGGLPTVRPGDYGEVTGGGGGAGAVGGNGSSNSTGEGGAGLPWLNGTYYAGGGGGGGALLLGAGGTFGAGGIGGGGRGGDRSSQPDGSPGTANTGGGGGGNSVTSTAVNPQIPGNGGSGVVIIRYKAD